MCTNLRFVWERSFLLTISTLLGNWELHLTLAQVSALAFLSDFGDFGALTKKHEMSCMGKLCFSAQPT